MNHSHSNHHTTLQSYSIILGIVLESGGREGHELCFYPYFLQNMLYSSWEEWSTHTKGKLRAGYSRYLNEWFKLHVCQLLLQLAHESMECHSQKIDRAETDRSRLRDVQGLVGRGHLFNRGCAVKPTTCQPMTLWDLPASLGSQQDKVLYN